MKGQGGYVPPLYVLLGQSGADEDAGSEGFDVDSSSSRPRRPPVVVKDSIQWSSGICACCDDMQSCCIGTVCPCYLFGKNAEFLGSGTLAGSCMTHFILWGLLNSLCCLCTGGLFALMPGSMVACYACGYRKALRTKYDIQEAPCGDLPTHLFCHLCAVCQEYREIHERSDGSFSVFKYHDVTPPETQTMEMNPVE